MKKKFIFCLVLLVFMVGCGRVGGEEQAPMLVYSVQEIPMPEPNEDIGEELTYITEDDYKLVSGTLYRLVTAFREGEGKVQWYLQTLSEPYVAWNTVRLETSPDLGGKEVTVKQRGITEDGNVYFIYSGNGEEEFIFVLQDGIWSDVDALPVRDIGENIFTADNQALYRQEGGQQEKLLSWSSYGISLTDTPMLWAESENYMILLGTTRYRYRLLKVEKGLNDQVQEKQQITLVAFLTPSLQKAIVEFNKQSDDYEVVARDCYQESFADLQQRFRAEMIGGEGPDLIHNLFVSLYPYAKSGYLEPLDDWLPENRLLPQAVDSGKVEGHCYIAPYEFSLQSLVTTKDIAREHTQWTLEEMMEIMSERPAEAFYNDADGASVLYCMIGMDEENTDFVDWEKGVCHFETEEFVSLLECSKTWADKRGEQDVLYGGEELRKGQVLLRQLVRTPNSLEYYFQNLDELGGACVYIGYPVKSGNGSFIEGWGFAINRSSSCKDGAKAFLEYLMSTEKQWEQWEQKGALPVDKEVLEQAMAEATRTLLDAQDSSASPNTTYGEAEIQYYYQLLLNSKTLGNRYEEIRAILSEETSSYYEGNRDPWEVARVLQSRIQLYLDEQK